MNNELTPSEHLVMSALTVKPVCSLEISLQSKLPVVECDKILASLASSGAIQERIYSARGHKLYCKWNEYRGKRLKDIPQ